MLKTIKKLIKDISGATNPDAKADGEPGDKTRNPVYGPDN
jgi:hypothetical protein